MTVVLPIRNESAYIAATLRSIFQQDYPADSLELIIVDGNSTDDTREIVGRLLAGRDNAYLLSNPRQYVPFGLNIAIREARGEVVIWLDGHCEVAPDYVRQCVAALQDDEVHCAGGPIETIGATYEGGAIAAAMSHPFGVGGSKFRTVHDRRLLVDTVAFPAYRRQVLEQVGPFDEELVRNQDEEYNYRLRALGGRILLSPDIRSRYFGRGTLVRLWRQYFQYGMWKIRVLQKHPRQMQWRHFVPAGFVCLLVVAGVFDAAWTHGRGLAVVLGVYGLAALAASLSAARRHGWRYLPLLPVVFLVLHLSYGLGWLRGLACFWNRWGDRYRPGAEESLGATLQSEALMEQR